MIAGTRHTWYTFALLATLAWLCFTFFALKQSQNFRQVYCSQKTVENDDDHDIFENSNLAPNDSIVLTYIRRYILQPPLPLPYNLKFPTADPSRREGQNQFVLNLLKNKVRRRSYYDFCRHNRLISSYSCNFSLAKRNIHRGGCQRWRILVDDVDAGTGLRMDGFPHRTRFNRLCATAIKKTEGVASQYLFIAPTAKGNQINVQFYHKK